MFNDLEQINLSVASQIEMTAKWKQFIHESWRKSLRNPALYRKKINISKNRRKNDYNLYENLTVNQWIFVKHSLFDTFTTISKRSRQIAHQNKLLKLFKFFVFR